MQDVQIRWGVHLDDGGTRVRAFVQIVTVSGKTISERLTTYRLADPAELAYLRSDDEDGERDYRIARTFFATPEALEGIAETVPDWFTR